MSDIGRSLLEAGRMLAETWWALVLGFGVSGLVQTWVPKAAIRRTLGDHGPKAIGSASALGVLSSSCSYAASALARTLFSRGADFTTSMVFMVAATNLVVELGLVLWILIGWQFLVAEFVGGAIMIVLLAVVLPRVIPPGQPSRQTVAAPEHDPVLTSRTSWSDAAAAMIGDLTMVRRELVIGFVVAGFASELVPNHVWQALFITGHGFGSTVENAIVGPFIAIISFVCSVGNVALAAALWHGGASLGGVTAFVFADLITLPLLAIYRRYYGLPITLRLLAVFWTVMSIAGVVTQELFKLLTISDPGRGIAVSSYHVGLNPTTVLDLIALAVAAGAWWLARHRGESEQYAIDPICGMQVEVGVATAKVAADGTTAWFCSEHCARRWDAELPAGSLNS